MFVPGERGILSVPRVYCSGRIRSTVLVMITEGRIEGLGFPFLEGRLGKSNSRGCSRTKSWGNFATYV